MSGKKFKRIIIYLITIVFIFGIVGCGKNENDVSSSSTVEDSPIVVNLQGGTDYGYPSPYAHYSRGPGSYKMELIFDSLLERGEKGLIPWLAEKWEISPDGKKYIFTIRDNVKWHDGNAMTAEDVKFSFEYFNEHIPVKNYLLVDGKPFIENIDVLDEKTVEITVKQPIATVLQKLGSARIIPKHIWENVEEPEKFMAKEAVVGCGPYMLTEYDKEQGIYKFEAFQDYWGPKQKIDVLQFVPVPNNNALLAFENGDIDLTSITPDVLSKYENNSEYKIIKNPPFWGYRLMFNMEKRPELSNKEVRQAIVHAINQDELVEKVARGAGMPGSAGYLPEGHIWYNPNVKSYEFNVEKSKELLKGEKLSFTLISGNSNAEIRIAELLKISLGQAGIQVNIQSLDTKSRDAALKNGEYEMLIYGSGGIGNDADVLRTRYTREQLSGKGSLSNGIPGYSNAEINELSKQQLFEMDSEKRKELIFQLQELIAEEVPLIPLYNTTNYMVYRPAKYDGWKYMFDHHEVSHGKISYLDVE